jgi:hypothetical protein
MVLGFHFIEEIETIHGKLKVGPLAIEPVQDIAVLGALDEQYFCGEATMFEEFCEKIKPVPICVNNFELFQNFPVYIYTHKMEWIKGKAQQCEYDAPMLAIETEVQVEEGTSGSPIINESGELVGIVSHFSISSENSKSAGLVPSPHLALPVWVWQTIEKNKCDESSVETHFS